LSISSSDKSLYAFWIASDDVYGKSGSVGATSNTKWDTSNTKLYDHTTGGTTNTNVLSMYEVDSLKTPLLWTKEASGTYKVASELSTATKYTFGVTGNWQTAVTGVFAANAGTVTLNGTGAQTVTTGGLGSAFTNLTITNTSTGGVTFSDALYTRNLNVTTGDVKLYFAASPSIIHTVTDTFNIQGTSGHLITLAPSTPTTQWYLNAPTSTVSYVNVTYSTEAAGSQITANTSTGSNNIRWTINP
jgi:hypothetical protein